MLEWGCSGWYQKPGPRSGTRGQRMNAEVKPILQVLSGLPHAWKRKRNDFTLPLCSLAPLANPASVQITWEFVECGENPTTVHVVSLLRKCISSNEITLTCALGTYSPEVRSHVKGQLIEWVIGFQSWLLHYVPQ